MAERLRPAARAWRLAVLVLVALAVLLPVAATVLGGFKDVGELRVAPFALPAVWHAEHYGEILASARYWQLMGNSLLIAGATTLLTLWLASMAGFVMSHLRFAGQRFIAAYLMLGLMFPAATAILPLFIQVRDLGLLDTHAGVVLPSVAFSLSGAALLFRGFFSALPAELLDAALIDGASYPRFYWSVVLPLSRPILATVGVTTFTGTWNSYLLPLILLNSETRYPWPLGLMAYMGEHGTDWPRVLAFVSLTLAPVVLLFVLAQRHLVAGLTAGAVKG